MATSSQWNVLVYAPLPFTSHELCDAVRRQSWIKGTVGDESCTMRGRGLNLAVDWAHSIEQVMDRLLDGYYHLVVIDIRNIPHPEANPTQQEESVRDLFRAMRSQRDRERRFPRGRMAILVGDADQERVDRLIFHYGRRHLGACLRDGSLSVQDPGHYDKAKDRFVESFWSFCKNLLCQRRTGKKALNLAGGGISGMYYQLGVLKCLDDAFDGGLRDFDTFIGVSGGAVVASCLANQLSVDEMIRKIGSLDATWEFQLRLSWRHLNVSEVPKRLFLVQREMFKYARRMLRREDDLSIASIIGTWAVLFGPIFDNTEFENALRDLFTQEGRSNDFKELEHELLIGATDQDQRKHVLFGADNNSDVPISRALQASTAMHPFFPSVEIKGRRYTDGIVTRTSNLGESLSRGADLVFVIDPFVPLISDEPGYNSRHGNMWLVEQDYKTLSYTRFEQARDQITRSNPHVNIYTFLPSNRMRHLMSKHNPFVARNFHPLVCEAYRSTYRRLETLAYKMTHELKAHDIELNLERARCKVETLRQASKPDVQLLLDDEEKADSSAA